MLADEVLEDIKVRACVAGRFEAGPDGEPPKLPAMQYRLPSGRSILLDHALRTTACDVLFEGFGADERGADAARFVLEEKGDVTLIPISSEAAASTGNRVAVGDDESIPRAILDTLLRCPRDTRKALAQRVFVCGGTSMLPGFQHRLLQELKQLVTSNSQYAELAGTEVTRTVLTLQLSATGGELVDEVMVASHRSPITDVLCRKLGSCQVSSATIKVKDGKVECTVISPDDPDTELLQGAVPVGQRSYNTDSVEKSQAQYRTGVGDAFKFFRSSFPANYSTWLGAAMFAALECFTDRSLAKDAYLKSPVLPDWCTVGEGRLKATEKLAEKPVAPARATHHKTPFDRPRAWGLGSLAETKPLSLVP